MRQPAAARRRGPPAAAPPAPRSPPPPRSPAAGPAGSRALGDNPERYVEHRLERLHGHALVRLVVALGAVGDVEAGQPGGYEDVRVAAAARRDVARLDSQCVE